MTCPRCQAPVNDGAPMCARCHQPFVYLPRPRPRRRTKWAMVAMLLLIAGGVLAFGGFGVKLFAAKSSPGSGALNRENLVQTVQSLAAGQAPDPSVLAAAAKSPEEILQAAAPPPPPPVMAYVPAPSAPSLAAEGSPAPSLPQVDDGMPPAVRHWLEHLERCERARGELAQSQLGRAIALLAGVRAASSSQMVADLIDPDAPTPDFDRRTPQARQVQGDTAALREPWLRLAALFASVPPPSECVGIRSDYDRVLGETGSMIAEIVGAIEGASQDPNGAIQALTAMMGRSNGRIDQFAKGADRGVEAVCDRYRTRKWFSVSEDFGGGLLGRLGL